VKGFETQVAVSKRWTWRWNRTDRKNKR